MNKLEEEIIGYIGSAMLICSFIPQIFKTHKTKKAEDISSFTILFQIATCIFTFCYGVIINANPIIVANAVVLFQLFYLLYASIYYVKKKENHFKISSI